MRILVALLLDTLPMLGNVVLLCFVLFSIFGIIGVQLWKGVLRNRCYLDFNTTLVNVSNETSWLNEFYQPDDSDSFICSEPGTSGMTTCSDIPAHGNKSQDCNATIDFLFNFYNKTDLEEMNCLNSLYTKCRRSDKNPFYGAVSFDNFGYAWLTIFQLINLENWSTIMYYIQDTHSFWNWIYFVLLILVKLSYFYLCFLYMLSLLYAFFKFSLVHIF